MQLHISPSLRHVTVLQGKGFREFIKVKVGSRKLSYRMLIYALLFSVFLLRLAFVMTAVETIDGQKKYCSTIDCLGKRLGRPRLLERQHHDSTVPEVIYQVFEEPSTSSLQEEIKHHPTGLSLSSSSSSSDQLLPQSLEEFTAQMKQTKPDAKTFAINLKNMINFLEQRTRTAKIQEYLYRHVASSSIPKSLHCLTLQLANEHTTNSAARLQLPSPEQVPYLVDNSFYHFVLASDNVLAAAVVAASLVRNAVRPEKIVLHVITDKKTYSPMQAWFSLHSLSPAVIEVKALHHFDWFTKGKVPVLEAMEKDQKVRAQFRGGQSAIVAATSSDKPNVIASKLQAFSPKYNSLMNHIRIYLPELFPSLDKIIFLDDDVVIQADMTPLWEIDMNGKVNGAVETCRGEDRFVMSKRLKNYLNFSHPLIAESFHPEECAWAYGMNIFDLQAWRKTNISQTYHHWLEQNLKSDLSLWQLGTLPPGLIAFHGHVHVIDPFWHMLGLGYQENTSFADAESAGVIHFNGRAKPWLEIAFPQLRPLWFKYLDLSDKYLKGCNIRTT